MMILIIMMEGTWYINVHETDQRGMKIRDEQLIRNMKKGSAGESFYHIYSKADPVCPRVSMNHIASILFIFSDLVLWFATHFIWIPASLKLSCKPCTQILVNKVI